MEFDITLIRDLGFPVALVLYLLWIRRQDDKRAATREEGLARRLRELEDRLETLNKEHAKELRGLHLSTMNVMRDLDVTLRSWKKRPCLAEAETAVIPKTPVKNQEHA